MSGYDDDPRVAPHPDGSWMVFSDDFRAEYKVLQQARLEGDGRLVPDPAGVWNAFDADGHPLHAASGMASRDEAIRALIGDPR